MYNCLLVDDERLARAELKRLLSAHPECVIVAEAANASEALTCLTTQSIDLVFLDIQMPGITGLQLAQQIQASTQFIFCTAYNSFALNAFELNAVDYLLKPIAPERLAKALQKLRPTSNSAAAHYLAEQHGILLKFGDSQRVVKLSEISRFESIGNHAAVYTPYGKSFIHSSLSKIEQKLDPALFFKASRADIVRISAISQIEPAIAEGSLIAVLDDGQRVDVSRRQAQLLKQQFSAF
ncbi:LytTR family DNA-binding domain-containing protein [Rheinheimera aquimaris]|uniref:LytTR family DNA-binding domain-containing protein n=1 Tax=Rheinheimera aquimaris TaxID=412437 RepID=A0ABN1DCL8_9GAMM|nr:LytTR family DNA-binding domain-containing protein [Rheinheimera aquimaris]MCB5212378.1 LytTR family DNA-binding domain-containing protein [Rheinheimera aquimaris]